MLRMNLLCLPLAMMVLAVGAQHCPYEAARSFGAACCPQGTNQGVVCREISYVLLAVSGTLEEGFELRRFFDDAVIEHHPTRMRRTKSVRDFLAGPSPWVVD